MELSFSPESIRPLIEAIVYEVLSRFDDQSDRIAFDEAEAAALLGVKYTTLRDERTRGRVKASLVGRKIRYTRQDLLEYLANRRWTKKTEEGKQNES